MQQGAIMFVASSVANALSYLLHVFVSRMLGPAEYGIFTSLLSIFLMLSIPAGIIQMTIAKYVSQFEARDQLAKVGALLMDALKRVSLCGFLAAFMLAVSSRYIASYLQIPSPIPVIVVASMVLLSLVSPIATGALQGLQKFWALGANGVLGATLRFGFAAGLVYVGLGASGALAASTLSGILAFLAALIPLAYVFRGRAAHHDVEAKEISQYSGLVFVGLLCFTVLTNVDVVIVKHYFPPIEAGYYSAASVLAKIIFFFPGAVATVMFPKASRNYAVGRDSAGIIRKSLLAIAILCGPLVIAYFLFPSFLVRILFGPGYEASVHLVGTYGLAMALFALVNMLLFYYLAVRNTNFVRLLLAATVGQVIALSLFHASLLQVIYVLTVSGFLTLALSEILCRGLTRPKVRISESEVEVQPFRGSR